jgi:tetratricopeptide (TPR) repeat protein
MSKKKQYKQAAELYRKAATTAQNQALEAFYLSDAGRAYELAGEKEEALEVFEQIKKKFPLSLEGREADKAIARLKL